VYVLFNVSQRVAAYRSVSQCVAACSIVEAIHTWEAAGSSMLHETARCISLSPKILGSLVLKLPIEAWGRMFCLLSERGSLGLISPLQSQILKSYIFQSNNLKSNTLPRQSNIFTGKSKIFKSKVFKGHILQIEHVPFANLQRDGDHNILGFVWSRPLTSVGMCLNSFFYGCFLANIYFFRFLFYVVLLRVFRHEI